MMKRLVWLGDSKKALKTFPVAAQRSFGFELKGVHERAQPSDSKPMMSIGRGVEEIRGMGRVRNISSDLHSAKAGSGVRSARIPKKNTEDKPKRSGSGAKTICKPLVTSGRPGDPDYEEFDSVWESLGFSPEESASLEARSELMIQLREIIRKQGWTQAAAAKRCGVSQPRVNDLLRGKIDKFSIDALVNMATALGRRVNFKLLAA